MPVQSPCDRRLDPHALWRAVCVFAADPTHVALWGVVLLAAIMRLAHLDVIEFKGDEAGHLVRALQIVEEHQLPLVGSQASVGIAKPPMMSLLMAIPLLFGRDPRLASGFIALLNVGAVAGCFLVARRYYSLRVAVIAAALFAANPWAVVFSRKIFTADVLAPFLVLYLYALHAAIVDRSAWGWLLAVFSLGIMLSITFSPLPLVLLLVVLIITYRRQVNWSHLFAGGGLALLLFVPYLYAQLGHLQDLKDLLRSMAQPVGAAQLGLNVLQAATWLHSGRNLGALAGMAFPMFAPAHSPLRALDGLAALLFVLAIPGIVGMGFEAWLRAEKRAQVSRYAVLSLWLVISLAVISLGIVSAETQYLIILYPVGFLAMALLIDRAWTALSALGRGRLNWARIGQLGLGAFLGTVILWQAYCVFYLYGFVAGHDTAGGYGVPLRAWQSISRGVRAHIAAEGRPELQVLGIDNAPWSSERNIVGYLFGRMVRLRIVGQGGKPGILLPEKDDALVLVMAVDDETRQLLARFGQEEERWLIPGNEWGVRLYRLRAVDETELAGDINLPGPASFANGMRLLGAWVPKAVHPGENLHVRTYWRYTGRVITPGTTDMAFNHLKDGADRTWGQNDGFALSQSKWREGVILLQWFDIALPADLPPGEYWLFTGMYSWQDMSRANVVDENGNPVSDSVKLGPIRVTAGG